MNDLEFGLNVVQNPSQSVDGFTTDKEQAGGSGNYNPYGPKYFDDPATTPTVASDARITSIPSPYARMHVTEIAFRILTAGNGRLSNFEYKKRFDEVLSGDYRRAISHCLDIFELLFRLDRYELVDLGISVERVKLTTLESVQKLPANTDSEKEKKRRLEKYIGTLDLFRNSYQSVINTRKGRGCPAYAFDFSTLYVFKHHGTAFAASSPFTGFFAKADCDISIQGKRENIGHVFLGAAANTWRNLPDRAQDFKEFMYVLLYDTGLKHVFPYLFKAVEDCFSDTEKNGLNNKRMAVEYPKFNFGENLLPQAIGGRVYVRPYDLDKSYLKYLLFLQNPVDLRYTEEELAQNIDQRNFNGQNLRWICGNDLLAETLVVLPYEISDNYVAAEFIDNTGLSAGRRCLLPFKRTALNYIALDELSKSITVREHDENHFSVVLEIKIVGGQNATDTTKVRRDYYLVTDKKNCTHPNGALVTGPMKFAFGIYPFVRSDKFQNIYKVALYNDFNANNYNCPISNCGAKFFSVQTDLTQTTSVVQYQEGNGSQEVISNQTLVADRASQDETANFNAFYYDVRKEGPQYAIDFVEITFDLTRGLEAAESKNISGSSIILPKLGRPNVVDNDPTVIAVDLGTSNTYVAFMHERQGQNNEIQEINTEHDDRNVNGQLWWEFVPLNKPNSDPEQASLLPKDHSDFFLSKEAGKKPCTDMLPAQLSEFIPAKIVPACNNTGYSFPIPTVVNELTTANDIPVSRALVHYNIPFAYYALGHRAADRISNGADFKWFYTERSVLDHADDNRQQREKALKRQCETFIDELLFVLRSHMLCNGYDLSKCQLIWTYPLSFGGSLLREYKGLWKKYFNEHFGVADNAIIETNESLSPIFEVTDANVQAKLTVVIDMGGGSTDVIGFRHNAPLFMSSFGFAGNDLYLNGVTLKDQDLNPLSNYLRLAIKGTELEAKLVENVNRLQGMKAIDKDANISNLMNYVFSQSEFSEAIGRLFDDRLVQYMMLLHQSAVIYHIAQLCKAWSDRHAEDVPECVRFTGNGSKMFTVINKNGYKNLLQDIFTHVYGKNMSFDLGYGNYDVKAATARGAIKGRANLHNLHGDKIIMFGTADDFKTPADNDGVPFADFGKNLADVCKNVEDFIKMIYDKNLLGNRPVLAKNELLQVFEDAKKNVVKPERMTDTLFFRYVAWLMQAASYKICNEILQDER